MMVCPSAVPWAGSKVVLKDGQWAEMTAGLWAAPRAGERVPTLAESWADLKADRWAASRVFHWVAWKVGSKAE